MIEDVHCPAPQPEDHNRDKDPGFCEDPDIYIEFDDGVFYQASLDGSEVAIIADYPRLYPFCIVSIQRLPKKRSSFVSLPVVLIWILTGSVLQGPYLLEGGPHARRSFKMKRDREYCEDLTIFQEVCVGERSISKFSCDHARSI